MGKSMTQDPYPELADPSTYAAPSGECDLIMKGGITSGVIYPRAACYLAKKYRFRQVGGASAGAIAAAFAAAAELGRTKPHPAGFTGLNALPDELGAKLATLFQPSKQTKAAFEILSDWIEPKWSLPRRLASIVRRVLMRAPIVAAIAFVVAMLPGVAVAAALQHGHAWPHWWTPRRSWWVWVPGSFVVALVAAVVALLLKTNRTMTANGFGLCNGHTRTDKKNPPLTDWMTDKLDTLAGLDELERPLRFRHLHEAVQPIELQVMTTCLTLRRPYKFPFTHKLFLFCQHCMFDYFPTAVVEAMGEVASSGGWKCPQHPHQTLYHLPDPDDMPVVIAARISLSFPGLMSAIPLYYIDRSRPKDKRDVVTTWFSDGGISSNFPMHFFDSLWPLRPTFGINLETFDADYPDDMVWRPSSPKQGLLPRVHPMKSLVGFVGSILDTMQNWNDTTQLTLPGFRDRVAEVRTLANEGGMNLRMDADVIKGLAVRGANAAALFDQFDLDLHKWIRYRVATNMLDTSLNKLHERYDPPAGGGYKQFIDAYGKTTSHYRFDDDGFRAADIVATGELMDAAGTWITAGDPATHPEHPKPQPLLRVVPPQ